MKPLSVLVFALCVIGAFAQDNTSPAGGVRDILNIYNECWNSEGLAPCLKMKALTLIDRVSRMEKITIADGVTIKGRTEEKPNEPTLEEEEKNLPRSLDEKNSALTKLIWNRIARMIGSRTIEISVPQVIESARKGDIDFEFDKEEEKEGLISKLIALIKLKKKKEFDIKEFIGQIIASKIAMIPVLKALLWLAAIKAFAQAKIALLIVGFIIIKKLLASKQGGTQVQHVSAGWSGGSGGWSGGAGGSGWEGGWDRRAFNAQNIAFNAQKTSSLVDVYV